ncbi:uncharacterized protein L201_000349 [Kwoniella dendrophila CBS 6074]|uniref:F-box domain-containing protein n=1 Tax=Kwoniella dendrophila CBS 6074 TaxID=1295534 RepID=A0AAX4JLQ5_9TREE
MSSSSSNQSGKRPSNIPLLPQQPHWTRPPPSPPNTSISFIPRNSIGEATIALSTISINQQPIPLPTPSPSIPQQQSSKSASNNALSPPTPAPSPSPKDRRIYRHDGDEEDFGQSDVDEREDRLNTLWKGKNKQRHTVADPQNLINQFTTLSPSQRFSFLASLIGELRLNEALVVSRKIEPLLRRDFLRELPAELALHCLSFVDEPKTLARAAQVSNYWNQLLQDEQTWKDLFKRHNFPIPFINSHRPNLGIRRRSTQTSVNSIVNSTTTVNINLNNSTTIPISSTKTKTRSSTTTSSSSSSASGSQSCINRTTPFGTERRVLSLSSSRSLKDKEDGTFKNRFKNAYLTESNWLSGGRILANHVSADDAVVTTLCFDDSHIVVGMANNKIHVFDAITGTFLRSLIGHRQGVWAMVLVSANPNGDLDDEVDDKRETTQKKKYSSNNGINETAWNGLFGMAGVGGKASESYRDNGQSRRSSFAGGPTFERHPPLGPSLLNSSSPGGIFPSSQINDSFNSQQQPIRPNTAMGFTSTSNNNGLLGLGIGNNDESFDHHPSSSDNQENPQVDTNNSNERSSMRSSDPCGCARGWKGNKNNLVISAGCDKEVKVWNLDSGELIYSMGGHTSTIRCLKVLDKRPIAISGSRDHTLRVWDIENGFLKHVLEGHEESVRCVEIAGNLAVSGSYDYTSRIWNLDSGQCLHVLRGHYHQIYSVAFDGQTVVTGSLDSTIRVWSGVTGECLALLQGHTALVGQLQLSSSRLITGGSDGRVIIFDLKSLTTSHRLCAHDNSVTCLQFDDRFIVSGGNDGRVKLWDCKSGRFIRELTRPCDAVWRIGFRSDRVVLLCQREGKTCLEVISFRPGEGERRSR